MDAAQPLLFVGKKAKHFYSKVEYSPELKQNRVTIFWGGARFAAYWEKDERPVRNTLAVAFANAGMSKEDIGRVLRMNPKQIFVYLRKGNSVAEGRPGRPLQVNEKVKAYVQSEYLRLCGEGRRRWRDEVRKRVSKKFHLDLSPNTLSHIVAPLSKGSYKQKHKCAKRPESAELSADSPSQSDCPSEKGEEPKSQSSPTTSAGKMNVSETSRPQGDESEDKVSLQDDSVRSRESAASSKEESSSQSESPERDGPIQIPFQPPLDPTELPEAQQVPSPIVVNTLNASMPSQAKLEERLKYGFHSRYAAALLLNPFIARLLQGVFDHERRFSAGAPFTFESFVLTFVQMNQYECNNYESILKVHPDEFGLLAGLDRSPSLSTLYRLTPDFLEALDPIDFSSRIARNYFRHLAIGSRLFFLDGHFQRYYGEKQLATGYHPQTRMPQRGYYQYILSGQDGAPLLLHDSDSLLCLSDSIAYLVSRLSPLLPEGATPWIVFDRGGREKELLSRFAGSQARGDQLAAHYIAWESQDDMDYSSMNLDWEEVILQLKGNDINHPRRVAFKVAEAPREVRRGIWANKSPVRAHRRLIVRRDYDRKGEVKSLCTPFCTDDWEAPRSNLLVGLTWRWRQENGFKLADNDYGFDNISSYATEKMTPDILADIPEAFRETVTQRKVTNRAVQKIDKERERLQSELGRISERLERVRRGEKVRADRSKLRLPDDPKALNELRNERLERLRQLDAERELLPKRVGRFERLCEEGTERLDFQKKWILDSLRACAYNARRLALDTWMSCYGNWRDYTQRFRDLLALGGDVRLRGRTVYVELKAMAQPRYREAAESFVKKLQRLSPQTFGIGPHDIRFEFRR